MAERISGGNGDHFNHHRLFGRIGHIPQAEAEANYYAPNQTLDMSHDSNETASGKPGTLHSWA
jgi:hypothetical protein